MNTNNAKFSNSDHYDASCMVTQSYYMHYHMVRLLSLSGCVLFQQIPYRGFVGYNIEYIGRSQVTMNIAASTRLIYSEFQENLFHLKIIQEQSLVFDGSVSGNASVMRYDSVTMIKVGLERFGNYRQRGVRLLLQPTNQQDDKGMSCPTQNSSVHNGTLVKRSNVYMFDIMTLCGSAFYPSIPTIQYILRLTPLSLKSNLKYVVYWLIEKVNDTCDKEHELNSVFVQHRSSIDLFAMTVNISQASVVLPELDISTVLRLDKKSHCSDMLLSYRVVHVKLIAQFNVYLQAIVILVSIVRCIIKVVKFV